MRLFCILLISLGILSSPGVAENPDSVSGPRLGIIHADGLGLRPLLGIPSSARVGSEPQEAHGLNVLASSATGRYALGVSKDGTVQVLRLTPGAGWDLTDLAVPGGVARIVVSPSGDAAILVYTTTGNVVCLTGLPEAPEVAWRNRLTGASAGVGNLALSDDGAVALASAGGDGQHFLARITAGEGWRNIGPLDGESLVQFQPDSHNAAVVEQASNRASLVYDAAGGAQMAPVGDSELGVSAPVAVAFSGDGERLLVANSSPAGVTEIRIADRTARTIPSRWAPTSLDRLSGDAVFSLGKPPGGPLMLYDGDHSPQTVALVVAPRTENAGEGGVE